jgi:quercetin dioxygenase-like cupin family protein
MSLRVRRVVTGHDEDGRALVAIDEVCRNVISRRPNHESCVVWSDGSFPVDNSVAADGALRQLGSTDPNGSVFRIVKYDPGVSPRNHRTESLDYAVVMSGEIDMELDDGIVVRLHQGDVLVQRGTIHNWVNRGNEPCIIAFVLIASKPLAVGEHVLRAVG